MVRSKYPNDKPRELNSRFGKIVESHPEGSRIKIDFQGNPHEQPIWGTLGRGFTQSEIHVAIDNELDCRIDFVAGDINLPTLTNIYYSMIDQQEITLKAQRVVLEATEEVTIGAGEAKTTFNGQDGRVVTSAKYINNSAEKMHKIQGKKVTLN
ncbi:hypothetical protein [Vibrio sp. RE88]|uniref:hypothetical protein n=1 Tax=Vibrio sp. RE88 TaxID=2607610 RepID=UPI00149373A7|nr:hypothetical protein [Vibrio sp. RE88]NOH61892.1 hypothetical protein [Vibrio sp. RE88]